MMMAATTLAVATPHALVLTVSHDLLFRQPPDVRRRECRPSGLITHRTSLQHDASFSTVSILTASFTTALAMHQQRNVTVQKPLCKRDRHRLYRSAVR